MIDGIPVDDTVDIDVDVRCVVVSISGLAVLYPCIRID
jgi:hypothetical protein